jgi:hypothetical protein
MNSPPSRREFAILLLLSISALVFEINLTRIFSITQYYHFAFMIVSLALLGSCASGTFLAICPQLSHANPKDSLGWLAAGCAVSIPCSYLLTNWLPFDSFTIAWDRKQIFILLLHYIVLAFPFFFSGMAASLLLQVYPHHRGSVYAINLAGSAIGCCVALVFPSFLDGEDMVLFNSSLSAVAGLFCTHPRQVDTSHLLLRKALRWGALCINSSLLALTLLFLGLKLSGGKTIQLLDMRLSPYKELSYALQYPDAQITRTLWNSFSRVDYVTSSGVRSFPGLSYQFMKPLPKEDALFIDGDSLSPVIRPGSNMEFAAYMPSAVAYRLLPQAEALILEPRGGLEILVAETSGAAAVTAVEMNPLVVELAKPIYGSHGLSVVIDSERSYLQHAQKHFDIIIFSQTDTFHPVSSGAYSLVEDYRHTVEAYQEALQHLEDRGVVVITSWLQTPPSEELRSFAIGITAIEQTGGNPGEQIVAFRGYNTLTILLKRAPFTHDELQIVRRFTASRAYDLVYSPDITPEDINQYNILSEEIYYQSFKNLLETQPRAAFYQNYPFHIKPTTDDYPFFYHLFKWSQASQVLSALGRTWQPFGGAGYFVILALLLITLVSAGFLILLPVFILRKSLAGGMQKAPPSAREKFLLPIYFGLIGFAYLLVEIPLIQQFILFLGQPAYAMTAVLFSLLLFSGLGSQYSARVPVKAALTILVLCLLSLPYRLAFAVAILAPVGFLMGIPFPAGLRWFLGEEKLSPRLPWVWSINGAASVIASVLAALLALSFGLAWTLRLGACCYAAALIMVLVSARPLFAVSRRR